MLRLPYLLVAALSGALFGAGLYVSQMVDPQKVLRFLDIGGLADGSWDPSLGFVIGPAIVITHLAIRFGRRRSAPLFDTRFHEPASKKSSSMLVVGSVLFGLGWGMAGLCPGPALSLIAFLPENLWIFLLTMLLGSLVGSRFIENR